VFETMMAFACENTFSDAPKCKLKVSKVILQQPIDRAQVEKLLAHKKTDLLRGFVSQRTRRRFSAYLVMGDDGKTTFEFEPRAEGGKGKKASPKKDAAETNGHPSVKSVMPKNVIKKGSRRKA